MGKHFAWKHKKSEEDEFAVNVLKFYVTCNLKAFNNAVLNYFKPYIICFMKYICNKKNLYLYLYAHKYHKHYIIYKYSLVSSATSNTILWHILTELLNKWCDYLPVLYLMYTYSVYKVAYIIWLKTRRRYITFKLIRFFSVRSFQVKNFSS